MLAAEGLMRCVWYRGRRAHQEVTGPELVPGSARCPRRGRFCTAGNLSRRRSDNCCTTGICPQQLRERAMRDVKSRLLCGRGAARICRAWQALGGYGNLHRGCLLSVTIMRDDSALAMAVHLRTMGWASDGSGGSRRPQRRSGPGSRPSALPRGPEGPR